MSVTPMPPPSHKPESKEEELAMEIYDTAPIFSARFEVRRGGAGSVGRGADGGGVKSRARHTGGGGRPRDCQHMHLHAQTCLALKRPACCL